MIFLTVGTQFPFDRLVAAVDLAVERGAVADQIFAQIGDSSYEPRHFEYVRSVDKDKYDSLVKDASGMIGHAGMGTILMALEYHKPLLVMPRLKQYGEVVNDHQVDIADKFAKLGYVLVAHQPKVLIETIKSLSSFVPRQRQNQLDDVINRVYTFLDNLAFSK